MTPALTWLFAVSGGAAVGNLYIAQPLLNYIAHNLHAPASEAGMLVTATQIGYAAGILLIVPLGDVRNRRHLIPLMMLLAAFFLLLCAVAPSIGVLLLSISGVGLTTIAGQILIPLAGDLADESKRGRIVGTVASGILTGILVSRTISGMVAGAIGWRALFAAAAAVDVVLATLLYRALPGLEPRQQVRYVRLILSVGRVVLAERAVRWTLLSGVTAFGTFTMLWTALTFLLSAPPFNYSVTVIGLFGPAWPARSRRNGRAVCTIAAGISGPRASPGYLPSAPLC